MDENRGDVSTEDEGEKVGSAICPDCSTSTGHEVLRRTRRGEGDDVLSRCVECGRVHTIEIRPPRAVTVRATLSDGRDSEQGSIEVDEDEVISVGDFFEHADALWEVTRIDGDASQPQDTLGASEIRAMWAVRRDRAVVRMTLTDGESSTPSSIECEPDRVFSCGEVLEVEGRKWRIRALHTGRGRTLRGSRAARELRRVYLHPVGYGN